MKLFLSMFITTVLLTACNNKNLSAPEEKILNIVEGACGTLEYEKNAGKNFEEAVKLVRNGVQDILPESYQVEKVPIIVDFKEDDRKFNGVKFINKDGISDIIGMAYAIDDFGNLYFINWCID